MIHGIYADYRGERYYGEIDTERIRPAGSRGPEGLGYCIRILDESGTRSSWMTATGAQGSITSRHGVSGSDGWAFWKLRETDEFIVVLIP